MDPDAQGENVQADSPDRSNMSDGVQARFNEMTARFRDLERVVAQKDELIHDLASKLTSRHEGAPDPTEAIISEIDEDDRKRFDALFKRYTAPYEQRNKMLEEQLQAMRQQTMLASVQDAQERELAQKYISAWQKQGVLGTVATEEDAILMARGKLAGTRQPYGSAETGMSGARAPQPTQPTATKLGVDDLLQNMDKHRDAEFEL